MTVLVIGPSNKGMKLAEPLSSTTLLPGFMSALGCASLVEAARSRVVSDEDALRAMTLWKQRRLERADIRTVRWARGAGVSLNLANGEWFTPAGPRHSTPVAMAYREETMQPTLLHLRAEESTAVGILQDWLGKALDPTETSSIAESNGWVTLAIDLDYFPTEEWMRLGERCDLFYESYSTSLLRGELVYISSGVLVRHLSCDTENLEDATDKGRLRCESSGPLHSWADVWGFVDEWRWIEEVARTETTG